MKIHRILGLAGTLVMAQLALAELPFSNDALGKIDGTLDFCAQANAPGAAQYKERKQQMVRDLPEQEVADARKTTEYKDSYEGVSAELAKAPKDQVVAGCKAYLEDK